MEIEDIEDIYRLACQAKQVQPFLLGSAYRFENYVHDFYNIDDDRETETHYVSENMIAHEATHLADVIETHEALLEDLRDAVDQLPECNSHRYIDGTQVRKEKMEEELTGLIDDYREDFDEVIRICGETAVEDLPGPQEVRSKRKRRKAQKDQISQNVFNSEITESFFAD